MLEKIVSLFERAVAALEKISAGSVALPSVVPVTGPGVSAETTPRQTRSRTTKAETPPASDNDFLGGSTAPVVEAKKYERVDVKAALMKLKDKVGQDVAFKLFVSVGGVPSLNDLPEEKFTAVVDAVNAELKK